MYCKTKRGHKQKESKMKKKLLAGLAVGVIMLGMAGIAYASPIDLTWTTTANNFDGSFSSVGVLGETITTTFAVDNGGSSTFSQSWSENDFLSYRIEGASGWWIENNYISTASSSGVFSTDSLGNVIAAGRWYGGYFDLLASPLITSWAGNIAGGWWNNGNNQVVAASAPYGGVWADSVNGNLIGSNWTATTTAPVPEPSTFLLFGAGVAGLAVWRKRRS